MSLFGTSPDEAPTTPKRSSGSQRSSGLFDDDQPRSRSHKKNSSSSGGGLFADDKSDAHGHDESSPWDMPTPRKQQSRAELIRRLLPADDAPETYIDVYESILRQDGSNSGRRIPAAGIAKLFAMARLDADAQATIMAVVAPGNASDVTLGQNEFNVLLALVGLAQEGDVISLDSVDERKSNLPRPKLEGLTAAPDIPPVTELSAKPPQSPEDLPNVTVPSPPNKQQQQAAAASPSPSPSHQRSNSAAKSNTLRPAMDDPEDDPWNSPEMHKGHAHTKQNGISNNASSSAGTQNGFGHSSQSSQPYNSTSGVSTSPTAARRSSGSGGWGDYGDSGNGLSAGGGFGNNSNNDPFGGDGASGQTPGGNQPPANPINPIRSVSGRTGNGIEESVRVTLMPGKEGIFMFQHHNYEVSSHRRESKVIRRYSDFVWLLDCLQKRYPFRVLPLLPPKRVAVNGNHLSNDGSFIEKRRRGLSRFLNALVRHPILSQEQLVIMFLTVPTVQELAVWRKQSTISVQDEFTDRHMPPGLEDSLPATLEDLFSRTRSGVRRSAELYINVCNIMDRLVKRTEGVAADHARIAMSLSSLTETSDDTYATDTNEVPLLNDGLTAMSKHLSTCQSLLEDESRGWDEGVLEDLKRQRDSLVAVREMFDRRERLDKDNIPHLEKRIQTSESRLAALRAKPEGTVKAGEIEKVAESIIKDKESIVQQHNRSVFVRECIRDELITFQSTQYHISRWNQDWASERVKYAEMLADNWRRLIDELEGMPLAE